MSMLQGLVIAEDAGWRRGGRFAVPVFNTEESRTKQEFAQECNINVIMAKYQRDGLLLHVNRFQGRYDDVSGAVPYHEAQNILLAAQDAFMSLPSSVRAQFDNDPGKFLEFASDPGNKERMREMGLLKEVPREAEQVREEVSSTAGAVEVAGGSDAGKSA